jgi:uncharacterized protein (DUF2252 family)
MSDLVRRILRANHGRSADLLPRKYAMMAADAFAFYRATAHLFYEDLRPAALPRSPQAWCSGDLHLENFGTFKGDNGLTYFDVNDFDEAALIPIAWDIARLACSVWVAGPALRMNARACRECVAEFLQDYCTQLSAGHARWLERSTAQGAIRELLKQLRSRDVSDVLDRRTQHVGNKLRMRIDNKRALPATREQRTRAFGLVRALRPGFPGSLKFKPIDAARRVAGLGSLGLERFIVLVRVGKGGRGYKAYEVLDLKEASPSVAARARGHQPRWPSEAARVIEIQRRCQAAAPAFLSWGAAQGKSFIIRQLQPLEDRLNLEMLARRPKAFRRAICAMARLIAWDHLRAAARQGAASPDELMAFGTRSSDWVPGVARYAQRYAQRVRRDHAAFARAWRAGGVPTQSPVSASARRAARRR